MTAVVTGLVGLVGVLVGVLLSFFLQRRLWQRQEATKAYAALFALGEEALQMGTSIEGRILDANRKILEAIQSQKAGPSAYKSDSSLVELQESVRLRYEKFGREAHLKLLQATAQCWLLERDSETRDHIKQFQEHYLAIKVALRMRFENIQIDWYSEGKCSNERQRRLEQRPHFDQLFDELGALREWVAGKHFHGGEANRGRENEGKRQQ